MGADDEAREDVAEDDRLAQPLEQHRRHRGDTQDYCDGLQKLMSAVHESPTGVSGEGHASGVHQERAGGPRRGRVTISGRSAVWLAAPGTEASRILCENAVMMASCRSRIRRITDGMCGWSLARPRAASTCCGSDVEGAAPTRASRSESTANRGRRHES